MSARLAMPRYDWWLLVLASLVATLGLLLTLTAESSAPSADLIGLPDGAVYGYDGGSREYDATANTFASVRSADRDTKSSLAPATQASAVFIVSLAELDAPRAPLRLSVSETWGNPNTLARHFRDHGADFAARNADEYANMASDFFQRSQLNRLPTRIDADGVIRVYDPATNTFGAFNPSGTTRTFFTPKRGIDYWCDQPGTSPWGP
jgi:hypothetical protein